MFDIDFTALDPEATLATAGSARAVAERAEVVVLQAGAPWADLHGQLDTDPDGHALPGMEQLVQLGGDGTPKWRSSPPLSWVLSWPCHHSTPGS